MRPDPEALHATVHIVSEGVSLLAYENGPRFSNALEVKRGMPGVGVPAPRSAMTPSAPKRLARAHLMLRLFGRADF
jgi:hypothetical protein